MGPRNYELGGGPEPHGKGTFEGGHVAAGLYVCRSVCPSELVSEKGFPSSDAQLMSQL